MLVYKKFGSELWPPPINGKGTCKPRIFFFIRRSKLGEKMNRRYTTEEARTCAAGKKCQRTVVRRDATARLS